MNCLAILSLITLTACGSTYVPIEEDLELQQDYLQAVEIKQLYRPEVYAEPEFEADCDEYKMEECFK